MSLPIPHELTLIYMQEPSAPSVSLGSVKAQVANLFGEALKKGFPEEKLVPQVAACNNPKFGDYQCNNAMSLFAKVKGKGEYKNPRSVGEVSGLVLGA
jgi:arginyl-tRNA synthetase